ncbi:glycosyltransferase [Streptomyces sp. ME02-8801-2C]|nr:glycosyltransferase [Streptomyces sp. ME02-8801-2C]
MRPQLSVVVPFHNVESYVGECLDSIARQTFDDFEVIMVDDASTDSSCEAAAAFARGDTRFRLVHQRKSGVGAARNTGLRQAAGRYLAFVDADDIVVPTAYENLVASLRRTGSDIACGGVRRFDGQGSWPSSLHAGIFDEEALRTHITKKTDLLGDRTVWNKVYCRSFWDRNDFRFPEHLHEDAPVAVAAHVLSQSVDVLDSTVYLWRVREGGPPSITQRLFEAAALDGRMEQVRTVSAFLAGHSPDLKRAYDLIALEHDVLILMLALPRAGTTRRDAILQFAESFLKGADEDTVQRISAETACYYRLLAERRIPELVRLAERQPYSTYL